MQNCPAATIGKGYSLYSELSGRHYRKGKILLGRPQSVFPFAKGKIPVGFALKSVTFDYMGCASSLPNRSHSKHTHTTMKVGPPTSGTRLFYVG